MPFLLKKFYRKSVDYKYIKVSLPLQEEFGFSFVEINNK